MFYGYKLNIEKSFIQIILILQILKRKVEEINIKNNFELFKITVDLFNISAKSYCVPKGI